MPLLRIHQVKKRFQRKKFWAVNGVSINISQKESFGLVGESGCGKTTLARIALGLLPMDAGRVEFGESKKNILDYSRKEMYNFRRRVQMIFQNPDVSLNPQMTIGKSIKEAIKHNPRSKGLKDSEVEALINEYLGMMDLDVKKARSLPDDLSGGEKRRIGVIRALAVGPDLIIADEPFVGLDLSIRNRLIDLLIERQFQDHLTYLFISHDIDIIKHLCSKMAVMYLGKIVEIGKSKVVISKEAKHPYTHGLLAASNYLRPDERRADLGWGVSYEDIFVVAGGGCPFQRRCYVYKSRLEPKQKSRCEEEPFLEEIDGDHSVACHFWQYAQ